MKIKSLLIAMMAVAVSMVGFTSCSDDDDEQVNNYVAYQQAVDAQVKAQNLARCFRFNMGPGFQGI